MAREAVMRPQGRHYSMAEHGRPESRQRLGNHILRSGSAQLWKPSWKGPTTIRIFPTKMVEDPNQWEPFRYAPDLNDPGNPNFGDWIRCYSVVNGIGDPGVSFITHDRTDKTIDPQMLPPWVLHRAIADAVSKGADQQGWAAMLKGADNRRALLDRPTDAYFVQGMLMQHAGKVCAPHPIGAGPGTELTVIQLPMGGCQRMFAGFQEVRQGLDPNAVNMADWEQTLVYGDPVALEYGRYITFYNLTEGDPRTRQAVYGQQRTAADMFAGGGSAFAGSTASREIGYGCYIEDNFMGTVGPNLKGVEQLIASKVKPWEQLLHFPSVEEQAALLADKFRPDVILYAWRDHPEWIPDSVHQAAANARQFASAAVPPQMPGTWPGQAYVPAPGQPYPAPGQPFVPGQGMQPQFMQQPQQTPAPGQPFVPQQQQQPQQQMPAPGQPFVPTQFVTPPVEMSQAWPQPAQAQQPQQFGQPQPAQPPLQQFGQPAPVQQFGQPVQQFGQPVQPVQQFGQPAPVQQFGQPVQQFGQPAPTQQPAQHAPFVPQPAPHGVPVQQQQLPFGAQPPTQLPQWGGGMVNTATQPAPAGTPVQDVAAPRAGIPAGAVPPIAPPPGSPPMGVQPVTGAPGNGAPESPASRAQTALARARAHASRV